tara:strand:+ start:2218 stop:2472 length:255 start_codon:yes stop_codon:yes gene_type:complete
MNEFLKHIEEKVKKNIKIEKILIVDNSSKHKKHKFFDSNKYHLTLEIHSNYLNSISKVSAQRQIMKILDKELKEKIHALEIKIK